MKEVKRDTWAEVLGKKILFYTSYIFYTSFFKEVCS